MKLTRRRYRQIAKLIRRTRPGSDLVRYLRNLMRRRGALRNPEKEMPYPTTLMLELTNKCNLRCTMCPREHAFGRHMPVGNMDTALAKKIVDEAYPYLHSIGLTGLGETLFATNLSEIARYVKTKKKSTVVSISTNANHPGFIENIKPALPYLDTIQVSIDGVGATYDLIRLGGRFETLEKNLAELEPLVRPYGIDLMFNMVVSPDNYRTMPDVVRFGARNNVRFVNFSMLNLASLPEESPEKYDFFESDEYRGVLAEVERLKKEYPDIEITGMMEAPRTEAPQCPLVHNHFQINFDGTVPPCCAKPFSAQLCYGNVTDRTLLEVLNSPTAKDFRAQWSKGQIPPFCRRCAQVARHN